MANEIGWGKGVNNDIGWGAYPVNDIGAGSIYAVSDFGETLGIKDSVSFILDDYPNAQLAYSLRQLKTGVTDVIKVRRDSDNVEQDFSSAEITNGTLAAFCNATDGFVSVWYDQSGNGINLDTSYSIAITQQPQIVSSGVVNVDGGLPYLQYDGGEGASTGALAAITTGLNDTSGSLFTVYNSTGTSGNMLQGNIAASYVGLFNSSEIGSPPNTSVGTPNYYKNGVVLSAPDRADIYTNYCTNQNVLVSVLTCDFSANAAWADKIAPYVYHSSSRTAAAKVVELIIYNSDQSTNQSDIESNINEYYTIF